ncbi:MAG: hypothetical protein JXB15_04080 [Anaerolineales bacterium]|nr:hypothetical protein [Anaerolineales bacterium]
MENIRDIITYQYPYPLAVAAKRFNDSFNHTDRFFSLATLIELTIKYIASIAMGQYLHDEQPVPALDDLLKNNLARPTLGMWNELMRNCLQYYQDHPDLEFAIPKLKRKFTEKFHSDDHSSEAIVEGFRYMAKFLRLGKESNKTSITLPQFFNLLVLFRNRTWGHGIDQLDPYTCEQHTNAMLPAIEQVLTEFEFLVQYPLRYIIEARMEKGKCVHSMFLYMGAQYQKDRKDYVGDYHQEQQLYLCNDDGLPLFSMHPLLIVQRRELFIIESNDGNKRITYRSITSGDEFEPHDIDNYRIACLDNAQGRSEVVELEVPPDGENNDTEPSAQPIAPPAGAGTDDASGQPAVPTDTPTPAEAVAPPQPAEEATTTAAPMPSPLTQEELDDLLARLESESLRLAQHMAQTGQDNPAASLAQQAHETITQVIDLVKAQKIQAAEEQTPSTEDDEEAIPKAETNTLLDELSLFIGNVIAAAYGNPYHRKQIEAECSKLEQRGLKLNEPIQRIIEEERDLASLTAGLNEDETTIITEILTQLGR